MAKIELRDVLLLAVIIMLAINISVSMKARSAEAETFKIDSCVTTSVSEQPMAYLHVVSH